MPSPLLKSDIKRAMAPHHWDLGNGVLYSLCKKHPGHQELPEILAKIWLIGRSYSASIERRKRVRKKSGSAPEVEGSFYLRKVGPAIRKSNIDRWMAALKDVKRIDHETLPKVVKVHARVTELFRSISGHDNRSLASKYLHFHRPDLFFIYDSQAKKGLSRLRTVLPRASRSQVEGDRQYRTFVEKCVQLRQYIVERFGLGEPTPRQIDKLLLAVAKRSAA